MNVVGKSPLIKYFNEATRRYYWRMMIGGRLVLDSTFRLTSQLLFQFSLLSFKIWELPAFVVCLPLMRFFTNSCYAIVLLKRAILDDELENWDTLFNIASAVIFLALGIAYLATSWAMQPITVFMLILATNVWDFLLEIKGFSQRELKIRSELKKLDKIDLEPEETFFIHQSIKNLRIQQKIQIWYMVNVLLTLGAVGLTLGALFVPGGFLATNIVYFSTPTFFLTGIACLIHGRKQSANDIKWAAVKNSFKEVQKRKRVPTPTEKNIASIHNMIDVQSNAQGGIKTVDAKSIPIIVTPSPRTAGLFVKDKPVPLYSPRPVDLNLPRRRSISIQGY